MSESGLRIRPMYLRDVGDSLLLSNAEGWNQTENDWKRLAKNPQNICRVAEQDNRIVGTATAINYANDVAWIGMVLVDKALRGKGISKMLLTDLINKLGSCRSVKLDATPAGQPVYEKYGFKDEYIIYRMTNLSPEGSGSREDTDGPQPVRLTDVSDIASLDHSVFGAERFYLLNSLLNEFPAKAWMVKQDGRITGYALGRQGVRYHQIGPVFADEFVVARSLIAKALSDLQGQPVVVDIPADKEELIGWLNAKGFVSQRHFVRMYMRVNPFPGRPENQYLICGPEFG